MSTATNHNANAVEYEQSFQGRHQGDGRGQLPTLSFSKKEEKRKRRKKGGNSRKKRRGKKKKIITNDHNAVHKWVKTDEFLRG